MYLLYALRETGSIDVELLINLTSAMGLPQISYKNASSYLEIFNNVIEGKIPAAVKAAFNKEMGSKGNKGSHLLESRLT
jgi:hypothetical protein